MNVFIKVLLLFFFTAIASASSSIEKKLYNIAIEQIKNNKTKQNIFKDSKSKLIYSAVGMYDFIYNGKKRKLVVTATRPKALWCHACAPYLSFFIFDDSKLVKSYINAFDMGAWGDPPSSDEFKIVNLNKNKSFLLLKAGGSGQGWSEDYIFLYQFKKDKVDNILKVLIAENNGGTGSDIVTDWSSTVKFKDSQSKFKDVVIEKKGLIKNKSFKTKEVYRYNGEKYINLLHKS